MSNVVGAYICPRGVFVVECRHRRTGVEVLRTTEAFARLESPQEASTQLVRALAQLGLKRARVAVVVRGFGAVHHILSLPPAVDAVLGSVVDREIRRLEPDLAAPRTAWVRLAAESTLELDQPQVLAGAMSGDVLEAFTGPIEAAGHVVEHVTLLPAAMHRLAAEFTAADVTTALIAQLPDGPYLGFTLGGAVRLVIEPPVRPEDPLPDAPAIAEELELGIVFVRQQFRGAQVGRAALICSTDSASDLESAIGARLELPMNRIAVQQLGPGAVAAFGAVLDARAPGALALTGRVRPVEASVSPALQVLASATAAVAGLVGIWALTTAWQSRSNASELGTLRARIEQESRSIAPAQETAEHRKLVRDALAAIRAVSGDRDALLRGLTSIATGVAGPVRIDSIRVERRGDGWNAEIGGTVLGVTSGHAVQALADFYRELPRRSEISSLTLKQMYYADTTGGLLVHFQLSFGLPGRRAN